MTGIWPWCLTLTLLITCSLKLYLNMAKIHHHATNEVVKGSKTYSLNRQIYRHTDAQTGRQTDRQTWLKTLPTHIRGWWKLNTYSKVSQCQCIFFINVAHNAIRVNSYFNCYSRRKRKNWRGISSCYRSNVFLSCTITFGSEVISVQFQSFQI